MYIEIKYMVLIVIYLKVQFRKHRVLKLIYFFLKLEIEVSIRIHFHGRIHFIRIYTVSNRFS